MSSDEQAGRDPRPPRERFELFDAIDEQLDTDMIDRVERHAAQRCAMLERVGLWAEPAELTQAALVSTYEGTRAWDPARCSLYWHLCRVIDSRTWRTMQQARKFPHERMGGDRGDDADPVETAASLQRPVTNPETAFLDADLAHRTAAALRSMASAKNDNQVLGIIDAYADGCTKRADVAERLGIGVRRFDQAHKRLMRLADKLPDVLEHREGAHND